MFSLRYVAAELRRRRGRTILTALGLGIGVGLVVAVTALSSGLDEAQSEVLEPLTGVGTDMAVNRPVSFDGGEAGIGGAGALSPSERRQLEEEGAGPPRFNLGELGDPGEQFEADQFVTMDLSFPGSEVRAIRDTEGVEAASASLSLNMMHIEGRVPEQTGEPQVFGGPPGAEGGSPGGFNVESTSVTGIDARRTDLGPVIAERVTAGRFLRADERGGALLSQAYADEEGLAVGDRVDVADRELEVVGLVSAPIGGDAADIYMPLVTLQRVSDNEGRVNALDVRAASVDEVDAVAGRIESEFSGSQVTTASELSERVSGSLVQAQDLSDSLGLALAIVALAAAFLSASFLTLSSVNKRTRELGTLKALGWRRWRVVRQVSGESLAQGLLGGAFGALIGLGGAAVIGALGISLEASAGAQQAVGPMGGPGGPLARQVTAGTSSVELGAPVDAALLALAIGLAVLGGLIAGTVGGIRAGRLRPAEALRSVE